MVLGLLLSGNAYAETKRLPKGTTVNSLLKDGYKLFSTDVYYAYDDGLLMIDAPTRRYRQYFGYIYHLIKDVRGSKPAELITCELTRTGLWGENANLKGDVMLSSGEVHCAKP